MKKYRYTVIEMTNGKKFITRASYTDDLKLEVDVKTHHVWLKNMENCYSSSSQFSKFKNRFKNLEFYNEN